MASGRQTGGGLLQTFRVLLMALLCLSSGLTAIYAGASPGVIVGATVAGLAVGGVVVTVALPTPDAETQESDPRLRWED